MSKTKTTKYYPPGKALVEIYQQVATKFAFAHKNKKGELVQSHPWIKCRDFLHDAVSGELHDYNVSIYGFTFNKAQAPEYNRVSTDETLLMISQQNIKLSISFRKKLTKSLRLINHYEDVLCLPNSTLEKLPTNNVDKNYKHVWLLKGPKFWMSAPHLISLLTLLLRLAEKLPKDKVIENPEEMLKTIAFSTENGDNDIRYLKQCYNKIGKLLLLSGKVEKIVGMKDGLSKLYDWKELDLAQTSFHNNSGILATCNGTTCYAKLNTFLIKELK